MKLRIMSDIHIEFGHFALPVMEDEKDQILIIAGDFAPWQRTDAFEHYIPIYSMRFAHVIIVAGNHEFYHGDITADSRDLLEFALKFENVHFLDDDLIEIEGVVFIGSTLWTSLNNGDVMVEFTAKRSMNDFRLINNDGEAFTSEDWKNLNRVSSMYIEKMLGRFVKQKRVVVTHHAPSINSVSEMYKDEHRLNPAFYDNKDEVMHSPIAPDLWIHGHMHNSSDYMNGSTRVICNPRGYDGYALNPEFNPTLIVEI